MTARAGRGGREMFYTAAFRKMPSLQAAGAWHFAMDAGEDVGEAPAGRPAPLLEVLPQEQVQWRTVEQIVDPVSEVPTLHVFVPQTVDHSCTWIRRFPSTRSSKCPRSRAHPAFLARFSVSRRKRNSWWKRQLSCLSWRLLSSPLTFQFALVVVLVDVFKVFSLARVPPRLWSRSLTFQFLILLSMEVFKVFIQDKVQQQSQSRSLTSQFRTVAGTSKILVSHRFLKKLLGKRFKGFLVLFPCGKKCAVGTALGVGGYMFCVSTLVAMDVFHTFFYVAADSNPEVLLSLLLQNGEACPVDAPGCSVAVRSSHLENWKYFDELHVAEMPDEGQHFLGHLCQTQVPG